MTPAKKRLHELVDALPEPHVRAAEQYLLSLQGPAASNDPQRHAAPRPPWEVAPPEQATPEQALAAWDQFYDALPPAARPLVEAMAARDRRYGQDFEHEAQELGPPPGAQLPGAHEITPEQAAAILNVSCEYLLGLLDRGALPSRKVGPHRRLCATDVVAYKARDDAARKTIVDELTAEGQRLGPDY